MSDAGIEGPGHRFRDGARRRGIDLLPGRKGILSGLDIVPSGINWCSEKITSKYPSYTFTLADIFNKEYNPAGRLKASEYRFPFDDETFDLAVLGSVFTHMLPEDMRHYIAEVARVLKRGGTCCASYNLLDAESLRTMEAGLGAFRFTRLGPHWVVDVSVPELAVAYEEDYARSCSRNTGCRARSTTAGGRVVRTHPASRLGSLTRTTRTSGTSIRTTWSRPSYDGVTPAASSRPGRLPPPGPQPAGPPQQLAGRAAQPAGRARSRWRTGAGAGAGGPRRPRTAA